MSSHQQHFCDRVLLFAILSTFNSIAFSQDADTVRKMLIVDLEVRPRAEFRNNYRLSPNDSLTREFYISQRNRIGITFYKRHIKFHTSVQEIHLWNKNEVVSSVGSINAFELYIEPAISKNVFLRIGRQGLSLDNGRLFSAAPWAQQCRSHEGLRLFYRTEYLNTDLTAAFTRSYSSVFEETYSPVTSHNYLLLFVHHFHYVVNKRLVITTINSLDVFEENNYSRFTNGGRLTSTFNDWEATVNAYVQYGKSPAGRTIRAYYIQPELKTKLNKTTFRLGAEILSGESNSTPEDITNSFVPLYGVAWKFMGNMNLFTRFPEDVANRGLINPYLFVIHRLGEKLSVRLDVNLFWSQFHLLEGKNNAGSYLGLEQDFSFNCQPVKTIELNFGFSALFPGKSVGLLSKVHDTGTTPVWSYLMVSYHPILLRSKMVTRMR